MAICQGVGEISGVLEEPDGNPAVGIMLVLDGTTFGDISNAEGSFKITNIPAGTYHLIISGLGFETIRKKVVVGSTPIVLKFILNEVVTELEELVVVGKSQATELREQAYAIEVIDAKGFKNLSTNGNDMLNKISGVNIRQSGGMGSEFTISLNGLSGNQVRTFLDGVPMDYFGTSLSLNNFSANLIERIEVYKGVVPIHLSSDALGGAINVVTGESIQPYLDISYAVGSYGTHMASLNGQYRSNISGLTVKAKSFFNSSENNYEVPVKLVNFDTGKQDEKPTMVERFHDGYQSKMGWLETGFTNTSFADRLLIGVLYSTNYKELQQPANAIGQAQIPYGEVTTEEKKYITNFTYAKQGLFQDRLNINSYIVRVVSETLSKDTSSFRYDWFGNKTPRTNNNSGEIENRKTLLTLKNQNYLANLNAEYQVSMNHNVALNYSLNHLKLKGHDEYKAQNNTQFSNPSTVYKQVIGGSYTNTFFGTRLKNTIFGKQYLYHISSLETNYQGTEVNLFSNSKHLMGFGASSTFRFDKVQLKASFENAVRFPEVIELFGDGLNYTPNPTLKPERSMNYNVGVIINTLRSAKLAINGFIRDAEDFIIPQVQGIKVFHINNGKVISKGIDLSGSWRYHKSMMLSLNANYLDLRDNNKWRNGEAGITNALYKVRLPNVPYLFGNVTAAYNKPKIIGQNDQLSFSIVQNYVHSFFYRWENLANKDKGTVPSQLTTNLEWIYSFNDETYNFSFGISNLFDADVYDNFQQLRPGRTFNMKFRYFIN